MRTVDLPNTVILDIEPLLQNLFRTLHPIQLTQHDVHSIISLIVTEMDTPALEDYYSHLSEASDNLNLVDRERRFMRLEDNHALTAAVVEFGVYFMELVIGHKLYCEGHMDPFPFLFVKLTGHAIVLRRCNFTPY